jgi:elongation of very long chain fatty acids protein 4
MEFYESLDREISNAVFTGFEKLLGKPLAQTNVTKGLPLVDSPTPIVIGLTSYLTFVFTGLFVLKAFNLKPRAKEPFILQVFVVFHNTVCFLLSLYMCLGIIRQAILDKFTLWGNPYKPTQVKMAHFLYIFYMSKYIEYLDTVIMILRHSTRQITVLHVYHHASISFIWWVIAYHAPGGEAYFSAALNSGVHVFMYLYYLLAATLGKDDRVRRKYLWWGKYLTQLQIFQFCLNLVQASNNLSTNCPYPVFLNRLLFYYMISLIALFVNFYIHKYIYPSKEVEKKVRKAKKAE